MKERKCAILLAIVVLVGVVYCNWPVEPEMTFDEYWASLGPDFHLDLIPTYLTIGNMVAEYDLITETGSQPSHRLMVPTTMEERMQRQEREKVNRRASRLLKSYVGEVYQKNAIYIEGNAQEYNPETGAFTYVYQQVPCTWYYPEGREDMQFLILRCRGEYTLWQFVTFPAEGEVDEIVKEAFPDAKFRISRFDAIH